MAGSYFGKRRKRGTIPATVPPVWYGNAAFALQLDSTRDRYYIDGVEYAGFTALLAGNGADFSRASTGYYPPSTGNFILFGVDAARIGDRGILIEPVATNLSLQASDLSLAAWTKFVTTITPDNDTAPNGLTEADLLTHTGTGASVTTTSTVSQTGNQLYTISRYVERSNGDWCKLEVTDNTANAWGYTFNINTGVVGSASIFGDGSVAAASISAVAGFSGLYRIALTGKYTATRNGLISLRFMNANGGNTANGNAAWAWGSQWQAGSEADSPIPTAGSAVTRSADIFTINVANGTYNVAFTFDDGTTQTINGVTASGGTGYTVPTNLNKRYIKDIVGMVA